MPHLSLSLKTVSPIWTGSKSDEMTYLRATSLIGGLRFWTEALLRGYGKQVCNITGSTRCILSDDQKPPCAACQIFGCTGMGRSFSMKIPENDLQSIKGHKITIKNDNRDNDSRWFMKNGMSGTFTLSLNSLRAGAPLDDFLLLALWVQLHYGAIGAQDQYGYGLVSFTDKQQEQELKKRATVAMEKIVASSADLVSVSTNGLANMGDFFFYSVDLKQNLLMPPDDIALRIRYDTRRALGDKTALRHYFCGSLHDPSQGGSKFNLGVRNGKIIGNGWFPRSGEYAPHREIAVNALKKSLSNNDATLLTSLQWREFNSSRSSRPSMDKFADFVNDLLVNPL